MPIDKYKTPAQKKQERKEFSSAVKTEQKKGKLGKAAVASVLAKRRKNAT